MEDRNRLPYPVLDALPLGAHRLVAHTDEELYAVTSVRIAFTGRAGGVSKGAFATLNCKADVGDDVSAVLQNRKLVCEAAGDAGAPIVVPSQVHGAELAVVSDVADAREDREHVADGVIVECAGVAALLNFADCLPLIIVSPSGRFAVVHCGWRGTVAHIASKAVRCLARNDEFPALWYNAYIGPYIHEECFEVGDGVAGRFREEFGDGPLHAGHVNLGRAVLADLQSSGLERERVADAGICTKCHPDLYFSYRATNGNCGRHAAFALRVSGRLG